MSMSLTDSSLFYSIQAYISSNKLFFHYLLINLLCFNCDIYGNIYTIAVGGRVHEQGGIKREEVMKVMGNLKNGRQQGWMGS